MMMPNKEHLENIALDALEYLIGQIPANKRAKKLYCCREYCAPTNFDRLSVFSPKYK